MLMKIPASEIPVHFFLSLKMTLHSFRNKVLFLKISTMHTIKMNDQIIRCANISLADVLSSSFQYMGRNPHKIYAPAAKIIPCFSFVSCIVLPPDLPLDMLFSG